MKMSLSTSLTLSAAALLAACSSPPAAPPAAAPVRVAAPAPAPAPAPAAPAAAVARAAPAPAVATVTLPDHLNPSSAISTGRSIYFDFDQSAVKSEFNGIVERHGKYLAANKALAIRVEGNTDERGSAEYNLALGQRRAESVVRALVTQGADGKQLEPVSWGEEKPKAAGGDESAWAQNRRVDLVYPSK